MKNRELDDKDQTAYYHYKVMCDTWFKAFIYIIVILITILAS